MKILMVTHFIPYPPHGGSIQRNYNLLKELARHHEIYYLTFTQRVLMPDEKLLQESLEVLKQFCTNVKVFKIPTDYSKLGWYMLLLKNTFSLTPYSVRRFESTELRAEIKQLMGEIDFDVFYADTIALAHYENLVPNLPKMLNHHNVESSLLIRRSRNEKNPLKRLYIYWQGWKVKRFEAKVASCYDLNICVSEIDKKELQANIKNTEFEIIANGTDLDYFTPQNAAPVRELIFAGGMTWYPNSDAMVFFCRDIFPLIQKQIPDIKMNVIGSKPPSELLKLAESNSGIAVHGYVDDVRPYLSRSSVYVVPIRVGGGTRLKILDAFAAGKALVSTSVGCEGIDVTPGEDILIGDSPEEFAENVIRVIKDEQLRKKMEAGGRKTAEEKYSWKIIGKKLNQAFLDLKNE